MQGIVFTASCEFLAEAMMEMRERFPGYGLKTLAQGLFFMDAQGQAEAVRDELLAKPAVFLHHMHLADRWAVQGFEDARVTVLERVAADSPLVEEGATVATQARSYGTRFDFPARELKEACDALLCDRDLKPTVKDPGWIISVTVCGDMLYYGLDLARHNLSNWAGGMIHFRKEASDISRAKYKLLEAFVRFQPDLPVQGNALDLGAAPGGWTSVLLERGLNVLAVDTGNMDERLSGRSGLEFRQQNVHELQLGADDQFDLITCDMSWSPFFTVQMINRLVKHLKTGGQVIMTVKLMGRKVRATLTQVIQELDDSLSVLHVQHLFHNRREVTLHLERR